MIIMEGLGHLTLCPKVLQKISVPWLALDLRAAPADLS